MLTSDEVLALERLPASVAVIGGGAIGCEFASMLSDLGSQVTVLEALPKMLPGCDKDVVDVVAALVPQARDRRAHRRDGDRAHAQRRRGRPSASATAESVDGRRRRGVGRAAAADRGTARPTGTGVERRRPGLRRSSTSTMRTAADGVWAVGDLVDTPQLAHVGFAEGILAIKQILGERGGAGRLHAGAVVHLLPPRGGLRRPDRGRRPGRPGIDVVVKKDPFGGNGRARIVGETDGLVKVIAEKLPDGRAGRILGVHMVGPWVTEQLGPGLPGGQLGGHARRGRPVHPAASRRCRRRSARPCSP